MPKSFEHSPRKSKWQIFISLKKKQSRKLSRVQYRPMHREPWDVVWHSHCRMLLAFGKSPTLPLPVSQVPPRAAGYLLQWRYSDSPGATARKQEKKRKLSLAFKEPNSPLFSQHNYSDMRQFWMAQTNSFTWFILPLISTFISSS